MSKQVENVKIKDLHNYMNDSFSFPKHEYCKKYLFIDLRDFEEEILKNNGDLEFNVFFSKNDQKSLTFPPFTNVTKAELKSISFPKMNNDDMYFIFDIYELNGRLFSSDNLGSHDSFAIVHYDASTQNAGYMRPMKGKDFDEKEIVFNPICPSLNRLTVAFKKYGGRVINVNDIDNTQIDIKTWLKKYPINFMIEFTCRVF